MTRLDIATLSMIAILMSACAGMPGKGTIPNGADRVEPASATEPAWVTQRTALIEALANLADVEAHEMDDGGLLVRLPAAHGFAPNSPSPTAALRGLLDQIIPPLREHEDNDVLILGHTDSIGSEVYNLSLSIQRAEAVMDYLLAGGLSLARLRADGRGESEPIADNGSEEGRATNRRVELVLSPKL